jgi:NYN domain/OST-HTH/LOTUS domain
MALQRSRIALLIDAENLSANYVAAIIAACGQRGKIQYQRAYGNWCKASLSNWEAIFRKYAIEPIQQFDFTKGKNAADIALAIDAMDILHRQEVDAFCIASNDGDFTPLVMRLRQSGLDVYGCGSAQASQAFQAACTYFITVGEATIPQQSIPELAPSTSKTTKLQLVPEPPPNPQTPKQPIPGKQLKQDTKLINALRQAIATTTMVDGWAGLSPVGIYLRQQGYEPKQYGYGKWITLLGAIDLLEIKRDQKSQTLVRISQKKKMA